MTNEKNSKQPGGYKPPQNTRKKRKKNRFQARVLAFLFLVVLAAAAYHLYYRYDGKQEQQARTDQIFFRNDEPSVPTVIAAPAGIPDFAGEDYIILNGNIPNFTEYDLTRITGESYSELDRLGRCGPACALLDRSVINRGDRSDIGMIRPSGWKTAKYPDVIEDNYLYNRCHLIAHALSGSNDIEENLITGTRHMNAVSMLAFELSVMQYLDRSDNHVLYRVTPYFREYELVARGVEMEAYSVEDRGKGLCFHVFVYNYQPGIEINYLTGDSRQKGK